MFFFFFWFYRQLSYLSRNVFGYSDLNFDISEFAVTDRIGMKVVFVSGRMRLPSLKVDGIEYSGEMNASGVSLLAEICPSIRKHPVL